ncbi:Tetratricopeptide TPR_2 repeat protein [Lunatimonas lonarensis]|uniref:Tetratricopeptide TPR_2 repeat protein n=1 Tax=Lunatimonas lonarensis TaxID=1232681 RepID=R7ZW39_9BACT|nr:tetratricopeptide repeat protein [Lunatimonas lonarensis]EON78228.1 Tetratricopeptide TPR_2 repeat protein [Lunatimonas lonarensis]
MTEEAINWNNQGVTHFFEQDWEKAHACYQKALQLDDKNPTVWNNLGLLAHQQKNYLEACTYFQQANVLDKKPVYLVNEANSRAMMGMFTETESLYLEAISMQPNHETALSSLAKLYTHQGRLDEAAARYQQLTGISNQPIYLFEMALVFIRLERFGDALRILYPLAENQPSTAHWFQIGRAEYLSNNHGLADSAFKRALAENPDDKASRNFYAVNLLAMNRVEEALKQYLLLSRLFPEDHEILTDLAVVLCSLERFDEASGYLNRALAVKPEYPKAKAYKKKIEELEQR